MLDTDATMSAERARVEVQPLSRYWLEPPSGVRGALLLSDAGFDERAIRAGVRRLRAALETDAPSRLRG